MGCCTKDRHGNTRIEPSQGEKVEPEYERESGLIKDRSCTDIICCIVFLANLVGMVYVGYLGYATGDPYRFIYGTDSWGNVCNVKNSGFANVSLSGRDMRDNPSLYYYNVLALLDSTDTLGSRRLCVTKCPNETISSDSDLTSFADDYNIVLCKYDIASSDYSSTSNGATSDCPSLPVEEHLTTLNRCLPESMATSATSVFGVASYQLTMLESTCEAAGDFFTKASGDIVNTWKEICYLLLIAIAASYIIIMLMRFLAAILIWTIVIVFALGAIAADGYCWYRYYSYWDNLDANSTSTEETAVDNWLTYSIIGAVAAGIVLLILLIMRKRIALVVQLFVEASKAMVDMPMLVLQPLWTLCGLLVVVAAAGIVYLYIDTAGTADVASDGTMEIVQDETLYWLQWYYLFGFLWLIAFVFACHTMIVAGAVVGWFFTRPNDKGNKTGWFIIGSHKRLFRYHMGTVAFGSFIIACIWFCKIVLAYVQNKLRGRAGPFVDFLLKCLAVFLWCFEKFMKFINTNAYIMCAIYGHFFCKAAAEGFILVLDNVLRVAAVNSVGFFVLVLGKVGVVAVVVVIGNEFWMNEDSTTLCYFWVPLALAGLGAFVIAHVFINVFGMVIDTILLCFIVDSKDNNGVDKPYFMSKGLMEYVENSKKALAIEEERGKQRKVKSDKKDEETKAPEKSTFKKGKSGGDE